MLLFVSVRKLVLDDPSELSLKLSGFADAQAGVDVFSGCQLKVVHLSVPWFGVWVRLRRSVSYVRTLSINLSGFFYRSQLKAQNVANLRQVRRSKSASTCEISFHCLRVWAPFAALRDFVGRQPERFGAGCDG